MNKHTILLLLALCSLGIVGSSQSLEEMPCTLENTTWADGEKLTYKVYYNWQFIWIPAGEVTFSITENADSYEFLVEGKSFPSYDSFFKVRDSYYSKIDKETFQPKYFIRNVAQDKYIRYDSIYFDYENNLIKEYFGKTKETAEYFEFEMNDCVQDMVSIMYYLRNYDDTYLYEGSKLPINVFFDKEYFDLDIKVTDTKTRRIKGMGKKPTIKISPQIVTGNVFKEGDEMSIYVLNDSSKIPLMIESAVTVGSVKAVLTDYANTKTQIFE